MADRLHRKESIKRIQVGLTGLAGIVLLIGLANVVVRNIRDGDTAGPAGLSTVAVNADDAANGVTAREPLAELGVAPAADVVPQVVPDLQPDPQIRKPMDREPARTAP